MAEGLFVSTVNNFPLIFPHEKGCPESAAASNHIEESHVHPLVLHFHLFAFVFASCGYKTICCYPTRTSGKRGEEESDDSVLKTISVWKMFCYSTGNLAEKDGTVDELALAHVMLKMMTRVFRRLLPCLSVPFLGASFSMVSVRSCAHRLKKS